MKKLVAVAVMSLCSLMLNVGIVSAQCDITNTGPDSTNTCEENTDTTVEVTCENNIYVVVNNSQSSGSGGANNSGNTNGGGATTGNAVNQNGQTVTIGAACVETAASVTPSTPNTPSGGKGGEAPAQVTAVPVGAVHAGGGAGSSHITAPLVFGMTASIAAAAIGLALVERKLASVWPQ